MKYVVQKYGGSSVATTDRIKNVANKIIKKKSQGYGVVVVVSAMGKTTNNLISLAHEITDNPVKREMDVLMSTGEQVSIALLSIALNTMGHDAISLTGAQAGIITSGPATKNKIMDINGDLIKSYLNDGKIVIVAGFQGINDYGDITTLGRGGSDTSAVAIACKIGCPCEIYTDVDGIYSVDPRLHPKAKQMKEISYGEMMELATLGAKVMEPRSVGIAANYNIPIYVASSMNDNEGTYIKEKVEMETNLIKGLSVLEDIMMATFEGLDVNGDIVKEIFGEVSNAKIILGLISQTLPIDGKQNVSFSMPKTDERAITEVGEKIEKEYPSVKFSKMTDVVQLSIVGYGLKSNYGVAGDVFRMLRGIDVNPVLISSTEISFSMLIQKDQAPKAVKLIAEFYNL